VTRALAVAVVVIAALAVLARAPRMVHDLSAKRSQNDAYSALGRTLAVADSMGVDDSFVIAALDTLPKNATYVVLRPPTSVVEAGKIASITQTGVTPLMRYYLLPRRQVPLRSAQYVLCYACGRKPAGVRWLFTAPGGYKIGKRTGT
jgi:hypothetical protein